MTRAYATPKAMIRTLQYLNPVNETISATKILTNNDSSIQRLDPDNCNCHVLLPSPVENEGLNFVIINASVNAGILEVYDHNDVTLISTISAGMYSSFYCIGGEYSILMNGVVDPSAYYNKTEVDNIVALLNHIETETIMIDDTMTTQDIIDTIDALPKYIHPGKTLEIFFEDGTYNFSMTETFRFEGFYGGGKISLTANPSSSGDKRAKFAASMSLGVTQLTDCDNISFEISNIQWEVDSTCITLSYTKQHCYLYVHDCIFVSSNGSAIRCMNPYSHIHLRVYNIKVKDGNSSILCIGDVYAQCNAIEDYTTGGASYPDYIYTAERGAKIMYASSGVHFNTALSHELTGGQTIAI